MRDCVLHRKYDCEEFEASIYKIHSHSKLHLCNLCHIESVNDDIYAHLSDSFFSGHTIVDFRGIVNTTQPMIDGGIDSR